MKILIAPSAFKGTFTAFEVAKAIRKGVEKAHPDAEIIMLPISDGGEGFLDVIMKARKGEYRISLVKDALGEPNRAFWGILPFPPTAIIELAQICGLSNVPEGLRNPAETTTYGIGQVIQEALDQGIRHFFIGLGDSAVNDAGTGLLSALGALFLDESGEELSQGGESLAHLARIDLSNLDPRLQESYFTVACDVNNKMIGPEGASLAFAMQKGANPEMAAHLEEALQNFTDVVKNQCFIDLNAIPGTGAAGGTAGGLKALLGADLTSGVDLVLDIVKFDEHLRGADMVIVGEGRIDAQTLHNKGPIGVAVRAKALGIPVIAFVGSVGEGYEAVYQYGITKVVTISDIEKIP